LTKENNVDNNSTTSAARLYAWNSLERTK